jgi:hypothetical protein
MTWVHELGINCVAAKYAYWVTCMIELGTINVDNSSARRRSSQRRHLRKTWWVEENELEGIRNILIVKTQ